MAMLKRNMTRRELLAMTVAAGTLRAQSAGDSMGAARDLLYQALELLSADAKPAEVTRGVRFLRGALDQYPSFGDAHYYRALCLRRLNQEPGLQKNDLQAAERYQSEALRDNRDPFSLAVPRIYENLATVGQKWALVVGISQFQPDVGAESLRFAAADATSFAEVLRDPQVGRFPSNQVYLLTNDKATAGSIKARLNNIATKAKPEDIVVVYVSSHGSSRADDLRGVSYLYTYDTNVTSRDQIFGTALAMVEVSSIISTRCAAQRTVVVFDTCHSGAGSYAQPLSSGEIDRLRAGAGRYVLTSCEADELAYEDAGNGFFTASLIAQLRARKGCIRLSDLHPLIRQEVSDRAMRAKGKPQRPVMTTSQNAAPIVLGVPPGGASDACAA
jgi:hypothetical protein